MSGILAAPPHRNLSGVTREKLNFDEHVQSKISKCGKFISIIKRLSTTFLRDVLLTIYKSFVRLLLNYPDIVCGKFISPENSERSIQSMPSITGLFKEHLEINFIRNQDFDHLVIDNGIENLLFLIRLSVTCHQHILPLA